MKSIKKNAILNAVKVLMSMLFPLISFPYATRILGPDNIGKVDFASSIVAYFVLAASLGITTYGIRQGAKLRDDKDKLSTFVQEIFLINLVTTILAYIVFFVVVFKVQRLQSYTSLLLITGLSIGFTTLGIDWLYGALEEYAYITIRSVIFQGIAILLLFTLVKDQDDYISYAFVQIFASLGSNALNLVHSRKIISWKKTSVYHFRPHIKPIFTIFGLNLACNIYMNLDKTMLGIVWGDKEVGLYSAALKLNRVILQLILSIGAVVVARLSYYHAKGENDKYQALFFRVFNYILLLAIPATLGMNLLSKETLILMSGNEFLTANVTTKILSSIIVIIGASNLIAVQVFIPTNREKYALYASSLAAIVNFILNCILIKRFGKNGAAFSTVMAELAALVVCVYFSKNMIHFKGIFKSILQYITAAIFIIPVYLLLNRMISDPYLLLFLATIVGAAVYGTVLLSIKNKSALEIKYMLTRRTKKWK